MGGQQKQDNNSTNKNEEEDDNDISETKVILTLNKSFQEQSQIV